MCLELAGVGVGVSEADHGLLWTGLDLQPIYSSMIQVIYSTSPVLSPRALKKLKRKTYFMAYAGHSDSPGYY